MFVARSSRAIVYVSGIKVYKIIKGEVRKGKGGGKSCFFFCFFSSITAVPSENQCLSSGAYECPVLVSLKHAVGLSQHFFLLQEWLSKLMACSPTCELHSRHLGCGLELILAVYREVHAHSFILKCLLQWHVHAQHY